MNAGVFIFVVALLAMVACSLYLGPRIQGDWIAMQWGFDRKPNWYAPKAIGLWTLPLLAILIFALARYRPDLVHGVSFGLIIIAACHLLILIAAARRGDRI